VEVIVMTERLHAVETSVSIHVKREDIIVKRMEKLDNLLLDVIDETLTSVFRELGAMFIYNYLANSAHLKREEIAEKPEVFSANFRILLSSGAQVIEKLILENLYSKLNLKFEEKGGHEFSDYIKELRERSSLAT
jgi:hypothetical protein